MADLYNEQRVLGVRLVADGTVMYRGRPVIGIRSVADATLFSINLRTLGVAILSADADIYNDQPVQPAVLISDGRTLYNGRLILPVRDLTWTAAQLGASLVAYLDPMDGATVLNGGNLASLANTGSGGAAWDLAQATAAAQPAYGATSFNGFPGFTTDGIDDFIETVGTAIPQPFTRFVLFSPGPLPPPTTSHIVNSYETSPNTALYQPGSTALNMYAGSPVQIGVLTPGEFYYACESYNGAASMGDLNGVTTAVINPGAQGISGLSLSIFASSNIQFATVGIINRQLTALEWAKLRARVIWRRGLASRLPASDPYKTRMPYTTDA